MKLLHSRSGLLLTLVKPGSRVHPLSCDHSLLIRRTYSLSHSNADSLHIQGHGLDIRIKWPNDIYSNGMKIGGILCHSSYRSKEFCVVIGVGLNLDNSQPTTCVNDALLRKHADLHQKALLQPITREVLFRQALNAFNCGPYA